LVRFTALILVLAGVCVLAVSLSCRPDAGEDPQARPIRAAEGVVIFVTGSELGALKPCGCSGGQLGGLSKRRSVFDRVPAENRMVIDTGSLVAGSQQQDVIKFRILFEAFRLLDYDMVHLATPDVEMVRNLGLLAEPDRGFELISAQWSDLEASRPRNFTRVFQLKGRQVTINVVAFDAQTDSPAQAAQFFSGQSKDLALSILLLQSWDSQSRRVWAEESGADCVICQADTDEPQVLSEPGVRPLVFTTGRFGRHIGRLEVDFSESGDRLVWRLEDIPVAEVLPEDEALKRLYRQYQRIVKDSRLLEAFPRVPLPQGLSYVGSAKCASCHEYEHERWSKKAHADAFATLVRVGSDHDPECVVCHVIGMDRESGFVTAETTPKMKNVGCENCHGPGFEHVRSMGATAPGTPRMTCLDCHTPEHSSGYAGHESEYLQKIKH